MAILAATLSVLWALPTTGPIKPTEGYLPQFTRVVARATRAEAPLVVNWPAQAQLESMPVTFGVPMPRGALRCKRNVRLLEDGREVTAAIHKTATWDHRDGDVKWLSVDATVRPGRRYALEFGTQVRPAEVPSPLGVEDKPDAVTVCTGPLRFVVSRVAPGLIHAAWLDNQTVIAPGANPPPSIVDDQGTTYPLAAGADYKVVVEQPGPLHAIVKIQGWHRSAQGRNLCQCIARLHAYAGTSFLRVEHALVVGFDTDKTRLAEITIPFQVGAGGEAVFGLDDGATRRAQAPARLVQDAADHFRLERADGTRIAAGKRAAGWVDFGRLTVGVRHLWQEHPRELEVNHGAVVAHLWAPHAGRPLDFGARAVLGPERYKEWDRVYHAGLYKGGLDQFDQAYGLAKSNDLLLVFHGADAGPGAAPCRTLDEPVIVAASPEWMCRSDVMGPIHPLDPGRFAEIERKMAAGFARFEWLRQHLGNYGLIDYGDVNYHLGQDLENKRWTPQPWRRFASRFYGHPVMPWVQFLRTGQRGYFQWGVDNARHVMDVDMCHLTEPKLDKRSGGRYGGDGGIIHYGARLYDIGCDSHVDHLLLQYYLTGYRRAWDVLQEEADYYLWKDTQPGGTMHGWGHRMTGGALRTLTALYRATWDERYLKLAQRQAEFCCANQDPEGVIRHDDVYMVPGLFSYYQATGDERMRELFLRCMRQHAVAGRNESDPRSFSFFGPSMAYFMTGDISFLRWPEQWKRDFVRCVGEGNDPFWRGNPEGQWDYCYLTLHLLYMPYYLEALAALGKPVQAMTLDNAITSGDILLAREDQKPLRVVVEWMCYDRHFCGPGVQRFGRYLARRPQPARVVARAPGGAEVAAAPITWQGDQRAGKVAVTLPAGPAGTYRLGIEDRGDLHFKLRLASSEVSKCAYSTQNEYLACADAYYFYVPPDVSQFELSFKTLALRERVTLEVRDPRGRSRKQATMEASASPPANYTGWSFDAAPAERGKLWRFTVSPPRAQVEQTYFRFQNVPPVVWTTPEAFFLPDAKALRPRARPAPVAEPYAGAGGARRIEAGKPLVIPRGESLGDGRYKNLDTRQGTLEFWFRPEWAADDILDRAIAGCGRLRLYRRSRVGIYLGLGGIRQSGFITESGRWHHLAITWDGGTPGVAPQTRLFINGVDLTGTTLSPVDKPLGDWSGDKLTIGGAVGCTIDDLRVSDTVRYKTDFDPPAAPPADEHTLLRELF